MFNIPTSLAITSQSGVILINLRGYPLADINVSLSSLEATVHYYHHYALTLPVLFVCNISGQYVVISLTDVVNLLNIHY